MENQENNQTQYLPSEKDLQGGEMPNKVITNMEENRCTFLWILYTT